MSRSLFTGATQRWPTSPLKHVVLLNPEVLPETTPPDTELSYVDIAALEGGDASAALTPKQLTFEAAPSRARRVLRSGDTVLSTVRTYLKAVANFPDAQPGLIASTGFAVLRPNGKLHSRFAYWAALSEPFIENVVAHSEGVSYPAINPSVLGSLHVPVPSLPEQARIANFLDDKTARIDALIAEKERLVGATSRLFSARLGTAVVEGLDGAGKLVAAANYGYEAVREDWGLVPLKHLASSRGGLTPSKDKPEYWDGTVPWVSPKDMKKFVITDSIDHVSETALEQTSLQVQPPNSVLVVVRGMILAHTFPVALNAVPVTINQDMKALHAKERVSAPYLAWMLRGLQPLVLSLTEESAHGTKALRTDQWANQRVPVPSAKEQEELVTKFKAWELEAQLLSEHLTTHIARLREYRSSLISAAVTGQIDVGAYEVAA